MTSRRIEQALSENIDSALGPNIQGLDSVSVSLVLIIAFTTFSTMEKSFLASRPILGLLGILTLFLAVGSAWGVLMLWYSYLALISFRPSKINKFRFQIPWQSINLAGIFLLLGVGLDDIFVLMNSWKRTEKSKTFSMRMRDCFEEAGVSLTITSATNVISFGLGATTGKVKWRATPTKMSSKIPFRF